MFVVRFPAFFMAAAMLVASMMTDMTGTARLKIPML